MRASISKSTNQAPKKRKAAVTVHVITLFPESLSSYLASSMMKRAQEDGLLVVKTYNPRDYTKDIHRRVDRRPYGGGPGMVMEAESILKACAAALKGKKSEDVAVVSFAPRAKEYTNAVAQKLSVKKHILLICGHYEGVDARVDSILKAKSYSIGPYVLTGGELPALVVIDSLTRQIPGVLGNGESLEEERTASSKVYTRPEVLEWKGKKYRVPKVLLSGNHKSIEEWKEKHR